jgi:hypothetical protein
MNFVCDWTFLPELAICAAAARVLWIDLRARWTAPTAEPGLGDEVGRLERRKVY